VIATLRALGASARRIALGRPTAADERAACVAVLALMGIGLLLRAAGTGEYGLSPDESWFVWLGASDRPADLWAYEKAISPHPPGNFVLLHLLTRVSWDLAWLRLPSVLAGTLLIGVCFGLARNLFGLAAGLAMATMVTFAPALVELSRVCRNYAPAFLLTVAAVYFLERFVRRERWRDLLLAGLLAPLAVSFHYVVTVVFVATGPVFCAGLARTRRAPSWWLRATLPALPLAVVAGFLYFAHLRVLPAHVAEVHRTWYDELFVRSPLDALLQWVRVWDYLLAGRGAWLAAGLCALGAVTSWRRGRRLAVVSCLAPLLLAGVLSAAGVLPVGDTRHSSYLFPFLFLLVVSQTEDLAGGYSQLRRRLRRGIASSAAPPSLSRLGVAVACLLAGLFVASSLEVYAAPASFREPRRPGRPARELLTYYPERDVNAAFDWLQEHAEGDEVVLLGLQGLLLVRTHFGMSPLVEPTPEERSVGDLRIALAEGEPLRFEANGVRYFYSPRIQARLSPMNLVAGLDHVRETFGIAEPRRVWVLRGGWDYAMAQVFDQHLPQVAYDREADRETGRVLFGIAPRDLRQASERFRPLVEAILQQGALP